MTNKEAIRLIQEIEEDGRNVNAEHIKALNLAIKALEQQLKCGCNTCEYYPMKDQRPQGETNADLFKQTFGIYATEVWSMSEDDFLKWLNQQIPQFAKGDET